MTVAEINLRHFINLGLCSSLMFFFPYLQISKSPEKLQLGLHMTEAFRINGVNQGTIKMTAPIVEFKIADPETLKGLSSCN